MDFFNQGVCYLRGIRPTDKACLIKATFWVSVAGDRYAMCAKCADGYLTVAPLALTIDTEGEYFDA